MGKRRRIHQDGGIVPVIMAAAKGAKLAGKVAGKASSAVGKAKGAAGKAGDIAGKAGDIAGKAKGAVPVPSTSGSASGGIDEFSLAKEKIQAKKALTEAEKGSKVEQTEQRRADAEIKASEASADLATSTKRNENLNLFRNIVDTITIPFRKLFHVLLHRDFPIAHYITLILIILFIAGGFGYFMFGKRTPSNQKRGNWFDRLIDKLFGYRIRYYSQTIGGVSLSSIPRPVINGRCDNTYYFEKSTGTGGLCVSTIHPTDMVWNVDTEKNKELSNIPASLVETKLSNQGKKFVVRIPWVADKSGMLFTPDCKNAKYSDGTSADLLIDKGDICEKNEKPRKDYEEAYRPTPSLSTFEGLDKFATENNPMC